MKANYHTHTRWCNHGEGEIEDFIEEAIRQNLTEIAITEHIPHEYNADSNRMVWDVFEDYNKALDAAVQKFAGSMRVIKGFEAEYYREEMPIYRHFREDLGYRLFILGQHRCGPEHSYNTFAEKGEEEIRAYAADVCEGIRTGFFDFVAHPDVVWQRCSEEFHPVVEEVMREIFRLCDETDTPVEINANGIRDGKPYPCKWIWRLSKEYRLRYLISSDAHRPEHLVDESVVKAEKFAKELGIEVMTGLTL